MSIQPELLLRLQFLARVTQKKCTHLTTTDQRLSVAELTPEVILILDENLGLSERVEAFVSRFGRLQDTRGDKLLPILLSALGERKSALIDNLDRAESLGLTGYLLRASKSTTKVILATEVTEDTERNILTTDPHG